MDLKQENQHYISKVYLKGFSTSYKGHQKVYAWNVAKNLLQEKSIESFLSDYDVFNLQSVNSTVEKLYEKRLNGSLETHFPKIIREIFDNKISDRGEAILKQYTANIYCRSKHFRTFILLLFDNSDFKKEFIHCLISNLKIYYHNNSIKVDKIELNNFQKFLLNNPISETFNHVMFTTTALYNYLIIDLKLIILESTNSDMRWFTSDNPVIITQNSSDKGKFQFLGVNTEIYFPLTPKYLAYFYYPESNSPNKIKEFKHRSINKVSARHTLNIIESVLTANAFEYLILPPCFRSA